MPDSFDPKNIYRLLLLALVFSMLPSLGKFPANAALSSAAQISLASGQMEGVTPWATPQLKPATGTQAMDYIKAAKGDRGLARKLAAKDGLTF